MGEKLTASSAMCAAALSCSTMKNSLENWRMAGRNCCNSITLWLILLTSLGFVTDKYQTVVMLTISYSLTDAISDWMLIVCAGVFITSYFLAYAYSWSVCGCLGVVTVNIFSNELSSCWDGQPWPKRRGAAVPLSQGELGPHLTQYYYYYYKTLMFRVALSRTNVAGPPNKH